MNPLKNVDIGKQVISGYSAEPFLCKPRPLPSVSLSQLGVGVGGGGVYKSPGKLKLKWFPLQWMDQGKTWKSTESLIYVKMDLAVT